MLWCTSRFEHCLGTAYLCGKLIDTLRDQHLHQNNQNNQNKEKQIKITKEEQIEITKKESLCVKIAGLCHDLGHGPFSHFFDGVFMPQAKSNSKWQHEQASCKLFDFMLKSNPSVRDGFKDYGLGQDEIDFIKELIMGLLCGVNI